MNVAKKTGWTEREKQAPRETMLKEIQQAIGQLEAQKRTLFSTIEAVHAELVSMRMICPLGGCAGSMGCACPC
jgi:hypothetical protein